jgi:hypothetical protein
MPGGACFPHPHLVHLKDNNWADKCAQFALAIWLVVQKKEPSEKQYLTNKNYIVTKQTKSKLGRNK